MGIKKLRKQLAKNPAYKDLLQDPDTIRAERCRRSFFYFVKQFWHTIIPAKPVYNWHIPYICEELEKITWPVIANENKKHDIVFNVPPGSTKSTICSQMFVAWVWIARLPRKGYEHIYEAAERMEAILAEQENREPNPISITGAHCRFIISSYKNTLSLEHAGYTRDIIKSEKYKKFFPEIEIRKDHDLKSNFKNTKGGQRYAASTGTTPTGVHAHFILSDDPVDPEQALSDVERETANRHVDVVLPTRKVDKRISVFCLIMQRLHKEDATGTILKKKEKGAKIRHIRLPASDEYTIRPAKLKEKYVDGLLDPIRMPKSALEESKLMGSYSYSGQFGQDPKPREGGMFEEGWFEIIEYAPESPFPIVRGWDIAATSEAESKVKKGAKPAYTAGIKLSYTDGIFYVQHAVRKKVGPGGLRKLMRNTAENDGEEVYIDFPQDPGAAGKIFAKDMSQHLNDFTVFYSPETGDKILRADPISAQAEAGNIKLVRGAWNDDFLEEFGLFPNGYKDQVDAIVRAYKRLLVYINDGRPVGGASGVKDGRPNDPTDIKKDPGTNMAVHY